MKAKSIVAPRTYKNCTVLKTSKITTVIAHDNNLGAATVYVMCIVYVWDGRTPAPDRLQAVTPRLYYLDGDIPRGNRGSISCASEYSNAFWRTQHLECLNTWIEINLYSNILRLYSVMWVWDVVYARGTLALMLMRFSCIVKIE